MGLFMAIAMGAMLVTFVVTTVIKHDNRHGSGHTQMCMMGCGMDHGDMQHGATGASMAISAYPIDYCIVSGEKLGAMGDPVIRSYDGREVRFCCNGCPPKFEKAKMKYLKQLDDAIIAKEKPSYPLLTCIVSGEKLGGDMGDPVDFVYNNRLVRFCCNGCVSKFMKERDKYLGKLRETEPSDSSPTDKSEPERKEPSKADHQH
jgi:YHS domain-containing protein